MKAVIFYFSGTGNTWYVSKKLASYLNQVNIESKFYSVEAIDSIKANKLVETNDIVLFGYPVYASYIPEPMLKFVEGLDDVVLKKTGVFCTQYVFSGDGSRVLCDILTEKGFLPKWSCHFNMPNNLNCGVFSFLPVTTDQEKLQKRLDKANNSIKKLAKYIYKDKVYLKDYGSFSKSLGKTQRPGNNMDLLLDRWKNFFSIDNKRCSQCGLCIKLCPNDNIKNINGEFSMCGNCAGCQRCHNFCPSKAIMNGKKISKKDAYKGPLPNFDPKELRKELQ